MATKISLELEYDKLVEGIDKSAAKFDSFAKKADKSIKIIDRGIDGLSKNEIRAYEAIKKSYEQHKQELRQLSNRYEELRVKQKSGIEMTKSEKAELQSVFSQYKKHSGAVNSLSRELKTFAGETKGLVSFFKKLVGVDLDTTISGWVSTLGALATSKTLDALMETLSITAKAGLDAQQLSAQFGTMANSIEGGTEIYRLFNDVASSTNYNQDAVTDMGKELMNLGYSAQNAADLITLCSDVAAGLGYGADGAQRLVDFISKIQSTGKLTVEQLAQLQAMGLDLEQVFSNMGMTASEAVNGLNKGTVDSQIAIKALTDYMHTFDGSMDTSKNNVIDQWGDITGNLTTCCAEIGKSIADAFQQSDILKELIDFTGLLIDMVRGEGCGAFTALGKVVGAVFDVLGVGVKAVIEGVELIMLFANMVGEGIMDLCRRIYDKLSWILEPLGKLYDIIKNILGALGEEIKAEFSSTFVQPTQTSDTQGENNFKRSISSYVNDSAVHTQNVSAILAETDAYQQLNLVQQKVAETSQKVTDNTISNINWMQELTNSFSSFGSDILNNGVNFMDGLSNAFQNFAESICNALMNIYIKGLLVNAVTGLFGGGGSNIISGDQFGLSSTPSNIISLFAGGGYISGPGTGTSDSIPAMLSNGEYVLNADAVRNIGVGNLNMLNSGARHFANGGYVGAGGGGANVTVEIINQSGQQLKGTQGTPRMDNLKGVIVPVVLEAYAENYGGMRNILQGAR